MLSYLEDLKLPIDNYVLDYFVIGVIVSVLLCHSELLILSFWAIAKNPHRKPFGLKPSGWQKRVILSLFYSVILRERKRPKNPIPLLSFLYKTCNKRFLGVLPPRNDKKGRRPFGLRLRVTFKKVKVKKRVTEKASFWTERKRSEESHPFPNKNLRRIPSF